MPSPAPAISIIAQAIAAGPNALTASPIAGGRAMPPAIDTATTVGVSPGRCSASQASPVGKSGPTAAPSSPYPSGASGSTRVAVAASTVRPVQAKTMARAE